MNAVDGDVERSNSEGRPLDEIAVEAISMSEVVSLAELSQDCVEITKEMKPLVPNRKGTDFKTSVIRAATVLKDIDFNDFKRRSTLFTYAKTENSKLFNVADEVVDPLVWQGTMGWR